MSTNTPANSDPLNATGHIDARRADPGGEVPSQPYDEALLDRIVALRVGETAAPDVKAAERRAILEGEARVVARFRRQLEALREEDETARRAPRVG